MAYRILLLFLFYLLFSTGLVAQSTTISIIVRADQVPSGEMVYIQGTIPILQGWDGKGMMLYKTGDNAWVGSFKAKVGETLLFRITRGSYDKEALVAGLQPLGDQVIHVSTNLVLQYHVRNWADKGAAHSAGSTPSMILGESNNMQPVEFFSRWRYHNKAAADGRISRSIKVMLPEKYEENPQQYYPVLLVHNGFDVFEQGYDSMHWSLKEVMDSLGAETGLPWIVVAIDNTDSYSLESGSAAQLELYSTYVAEDIKRLLSAHYRTLSGPENFVYAGKDMGGLAAFIIGWKHGNEIGKVICMNPKIEFPENYYTYMKEVVMSNPKSFMTKFYMDLDEESVRRNMLPGYEKMIHHFQNRGFSFSWMYDENNNRTTATWPERFKKGFNYVRLGY